MSFVTAFTVGTMIFVLGVPALMVLAMSTVSPMRRAAAYAPANGARDRATEAAASLSRVA